MIIVGDVFSNKKTGKLATIYLTGVYTGIYFIKFDDTQSIFGLSTRQLFDRWTLVP